jgi:uncharacterized surface protein with fasciclin (FAS1) repeats
VNFATLTWNCVRLWGPFKHNFEFRKNLFSEKNKLKMEKEMTGDIVAIATTDCKTLAAAVTAAGLIDTLRGEGPFTVFAPTDAAFAEIQSAVDNLLKPENKAELAKILTYHVVSGKMEAADLEDGQELTTVQGNKLKVMIKDGNVMVGNAKVIATDINASNGVIHAIDKVLLPKD